MSPLLQLLRDNLMTIYQILSTVLVLVFISPNAVNASGWNYDDTSSEGPSHWKEHNPTCGSKSQSPINIVTIGATADPTLTSITYVNYDAAPSEFKMDNNGHSVQITVPPSQNMYVMDGGLINKYILEQFHFHWGKDDTEGSEHVVNGKPHPLEIHLVHYSNKYGSVTEASADSSNPAAIAVIGIFVDVGTSKLSSTLGQLTDAFFQVSYKGNNTAVVPGFAMSSLVPKSSPYYRYSGSLTTPACAEVVVWTVYKDPIYITKAQMAAFRQFHTDGGAILLRNFRPPQPLNQRSIVVYH